MNLLDLLRAYPGGITQLARDTGVPSHTLYRLGHKSHHRKPVRVIDQVATAFNGKRIFDATYDAHTIARMWDEQLAERDAS
jgi:DNA-binding phage protein